MPKFHASYLETCGDEYIFSDPPFGSATDDDCSTNTNANSYTLINQHDGFILKPKNLIKKYQANTGNSKAQVKLLVHRKNFLST